MPVNVMALPSAAEMSTFGVKVREIVFGKPAAGFVCPALASKNRGATTVSGVAPEGNPRASPVGEVIASAANKNHPTATILIVGGTSCSLGGFMTVMLKA
jgi:hypothetical protein